jgi:hypothetical protein
LEKNKKQYKKNNAKPNNLNLSDLFTHFKNLYGTDNLNNDLNDDDLYDVIHDDDLDQEINFQELKHAVFSQNNGKSSGIDTIFAEIYKHSFDIIAPFLLSLFNRLLSKGEYPTSWGTGIIVPIFKGGDIEDAQNYRGITLINIIAKIYSQIILNRLKKWSIKHEKIIDNQFGFQKDKSTIDCIFILHSLIAKTLSLKKKLYCAFLDYEKCFDKLDRSFLFQKLLQQNVSSKLVKAIQSMYSVVKTCVRFNANLSHVFDSNIGVKQGDPSSSLLFLFFINDIMSNINSNIDGIFTINELKLYILLFADDAVLFAHTPQALQSMLNDLQNYCDAWGLKVNTKKTKVMIFEKGRHTTHNFIYNNTVLDVVDSFKYLGIHLFKNGGWFRSQKRIAQHSQFALHNLFIVFNQLELTINDKNKLFDSLVGSVLNYGAEVWGYYDSKDVEIVHCKFLRKVIGVKKSTNLDGLYGETGRYPMKIKRKLILAKYWVKLSNADNNSIRKQIFFMLKQDADNNCTYGELNWAFQIKKILNEIGMSYLWDIENLTAVHLQSIKQRILDIYKQSWYAGINNSNRLSSYCIYKHEFCLEKYLNCISKNNYRLSLARFRLSSHDLAIEKGRHTNIDRNDRKCVHCNMNVIETEYHFLLVCPKHSDLRKRFFKPYFCRWPNLQKFESIMSSGSTKMINNLAKFVHFAFKSRNNT